MHPRDLRIEDYTYNLPDERIARYPLVQRDAAKLLIYKGGRISEDVYRNISAYIPAGSLVVFNQTKVIHARLLFKKPSGSTIEVFCLGPHTQYPDIHNGMQQKKGVLWECLVGGAAKWKAGMVLRLANELPRFNLSAEIIGRNQSAYLLRLEWDNEELTFADVLYHAGKVPLPPYLRREAEAGDATRYQTMFAREEGSVAAPTAGLHFTPEVMNSFSENKTESAFVTLHVGAGTFKPVKSPTMAGHDMHAEWIDVSYETVLQLSRNAGRKTVAVGTTSLRTLESLYRMGNKLAHGETPDFKNVAVSQWEPYEAAGACTKEEALAALGECMKTNKWDRLVTRTQIIIAPGYEFKMADGLVTNFHQPQSTLLLLVAAFTAGKWRTLYDYALNHGFRFLSYGDGGLLWR